MQCNPGCFFGSPHIATPKRTEPPCQPKSLIALPRDISLRSLATSRRPALSDSWDQSSLLSQSSPLIVPCSGLPLMDSGGGLSPTLARDEVTAAIPSHNGPSHVKIVSVHVVSARYRHMYAIPDVSEFGRLSVAV